MEKLGSRNVYFQPPETLKMSYPCIVYAWSGNEVYHADDRPYRVKRKYSATVIDPNPDSEIPDKIAEMPMTELNRTYTTERLNHYVFTIYY